MCNLKYFPNRTCSFTRVFKWYFKSIDTFELLFKSGCSGNCEYSMDVTELNDICESMQSQRNVYKLQNPLSVIKLYQLNIQSVCFACLLASMHAHDDKQTFFFIFFYK